MARRPLGCTGVMGKRNTGLDLLRGIAAMAVLLFHYFANGADSIFGELPFATWLLHDGWAGVNLFFVLSGYLVSQPLLAGSLSAFPFYCRRLARTGPLLMLLLFVMLIGRLPGLTGGITWSLAVEEQFYLLLPLAVLKLRRRTLVGVLIAAAMLSSAMRHLTSGFVDPELLRALLPYNMDGLVLGVLIAIYRPRTSAWMSLVLAAALALGLRLAPAAEHYEWSWRYETYTLFSALAVIWITGARFVFPSWIGAIGRWSYPIYLFHLAVAVTIAAVEPGLAGGLVAVLCTVCLSAALHATVERPVQDWARRTWGGMLPVQSVA